MRKDFHIQGEKNWSIFRIVSELNRMSDFERTYISPEKNHDNLIFSDSYRFKASNVLWITHAMGDAHRGLAGNTYKEYIGFSCDMVSSLTSNERQADFKLIDGVLPDGAYFV